MPLRSILEVDVNDDSFRRFYAVFERYQDLVSRLPGKWNQVNQATVATKGDIADMSAALMAQQEILQKSAHIAETLGRSMGPVERSARNIASYIADTTRNLIRWSSITAITGGLLGLGGLFGLERLAHSASGMRRGAQGLSTTSGEQQAFEINTRRIMDPRAFLGNVNTALNDVTQRWVLGAAGLSQGQFATQNAVQVGIALLPAIKRIIDSAPAGQLAQVMQSRGLHHLISLDEATRIKNTPYDQLDEIIGNVRKDVRGLVIKDEDLKKWQDFHVQLERVGNTMYNSLVKGLTPLAPVLEKLSAAAASVLEAFLGSKMVKEGILYLTDSLNWFAKYVGTDEFKKDVTDFIDNIGHAGKAIVEFLKNLGMWMPNKSRWERGIDALGGPPPGSSKEDYSKWLAVPENRQRFDKWWRESDQGTKPAPGGRRASAFMGGDSDDNSVQIALKHIAQHESGNRNIMNAEGSSAGGYYQITDGTWNDFKGQVPGASRYSRAIDAPPDVQYAVAAAIYRRRGFQPWSSDAYGSGKGGAMTPQRIRDAQNEMNAIKQASTSGSGGYPFPTSPTRNRLMFPDLPTGKGYIPDTFGPGYPDLPRFSDSDWPASNRGPAHQGDPEWVGRLKRNNAVPPGASSPPAGDVDAKSYPVGRQSEIRIYNQTGGSAIIAAAQVA